MGEDDQAGRDGREISGFQSTVLDSGPGLVDEAIPDLPGGGDFRERYLEMRLLGRGGMGKVDLHADRRLRRQIAVKRIDKKRSGDTDLRRRFIREATIQAQLEHPSIVPVYDMGVDPDGVEFVQLYGLNPGA